MTETNGADKKRPRGDFFICSIRASFAGKKDLLNYIEENKLSDSDVSVIYGKKKAITREQIPVIDIQ